MITHAIYPTIKTKTNPTQSPTENSAFEASASYPKEFTIVGPYPAKDDATNAPHSDVRTCSHSLVSAS